MFGHYRTFGKRKGEDKTKEFIPSTLQQLQTAFTIRPMGTLYYLKLESIYTMCHLHVFLYSSGIMVTFVFQLEDVIGINVGRKECFLERVAKICLNSGGALLPSLTPLDVSDIAGSQGATP